MSDEAIKVDRTRSAHIAGEVSDFRNCGQQVFEFRHRSTGAFQRCAFIHIEHQQELVLVVEWKHLERHRSCRGHPGGGQSQPGHQNQKADGPKSSLQHRHHDGAKEAIEKRLFDEFRIVDIVD